MKVIGRLFSRLGLRAFAEIVGVVCVAAGASMWQPALGPVVLGVYAIVWANFGGDDGS